MSKIENKMAKIISNIGKFLIIILLVYIQIKVIEIQIYGISNKLLLYIDTVFIIVKVLFVIYIIYNFQSASYKMLWIIIIMFFPILGLIVFIIFGNTHISKDFIENVNAQRLDSNKYIKNNIEELDEIRKLDKLKYNQVRYLYNTNNMSIYKNSGLDYFEKAEDYFELMIKDILAAKKYIFLQFYSISEGVMWNRLFDAIKQKKQEGLEVYIIADSVGSFGILPNNFKKELDKFQIKYLLFNSSLANLNSYINYRSHRKITVIDGNISYTGGINIGDEYININKKFGHFKDTGIKIVGEPVLSHIVMFVQLWNMAKKKEKLEYKSFIYDNLKSTKMDGGYIMPYFDGPDNTSNPAQNLYIQLINTAKEYIYITTPYLILDSDVITALVNSAKSGVDVRIIVPYIPDKPIVHLIGRSFYQVLIDAGVKLYEYKPGFIHSKVFISDDELATVGSINLDFRGLYFHFECGNWIYKTGIERKIKDDFLKIQENSIQINSQEWKKRNIIKKVCDKILIAISPIF